METIEFDTFRDDFQTIFARALSGEEFLVTRTSFEFPDDEALDAMSDDEIDALEEEEVTRTALFRKKAEGDSIATSRKVAVPKKGAPRDLDGSFNHVAKDEHKRAFARPLSTEIAVLIPVEQ